MTAINILVVEDEDAIREMLVMVLEQASLSVIAVASAEEAQNSLADNSRPDLILLDWMLPGISGVELARRLKTDDLFKTLPIILLTADVRLQQNSETLAAGANAISYKPIDENDLIDKLCRLTGQPIQSIQENKRALLSLSANELSEEVAQQLTLIKKALGAEDLDALEDQVHQLSGIIGLSGLEGINEFVQNLHTAVLAGELSTINECFERLLTSWNNRSATVSTLKPLEH